MLLHHVRANGSSSESDLARAALHQQDTICPKFTTGLAAACQERAGKERGWFCSGCSQRSLLWVSLGCSCRTVFAWYFSVDHFQPGFCMFFLVQEKPLATALNTQIPDCTSLTELSAHRLVCVPALPCGHGNKGSFSGTMTPKIKGQLGTLAPAVH